MKKLALILAMLLMFTSACAEGFDFASMDDATLQAIIDGAKAELDSRKATETPVLIDQDGVLVYLNGNNEVIQYDEETIYLSLETVIENSSPNRIWIINESMSINGYNVYSDNFPPVDAGNKRNCNLEFCISDANIKTYEELEEMVASFEVVNDETNDTIFKSEPATLYF